MSSSLHNRYVLSQEERTIINDAVRELYCNGSLYTRDDSFEDYGWDMEEIKGEIYSGASKIVFCPTEADYVVKMPIKGSITRKNLEDEEDEYEEQQIQTYTNCQASTYCIDEYNIYSAAKENQVDNFFAYIEEIASPIDERIFLQEKVESYPLLESSTFTNLIKEKSSQSTAEIQNDVSNFVKEKNLLELFIAAQKDFDILFTLYDLYPLEQLQKLNDFIKEQHINDLAYHNLGTRTDGSLCFFDYCGFYY